MIVRMGAKGNNVPQTAMASKGAAMTGMQSKNRATWFPFQLSLGVY
jgi:hypothetical protein